MRAKVDIFDDGTPCPCSFFKGNEGNTILSYLYQMDVYISVAATANERHFAYPQILSAEQNELHLEEVFHPFLSAPKATPCQ